MSALPRVFLDRPIAHRALHDLSDKRPENSRAAIRAAIAVGVPIEIDVQLSADGVAMVFHDYDLDRLTHETGPIRFRTADALRQTTLRGSAQGIPALADVLDLVAGRVPVLVEIKDQDGDLGPNIGALEAATAKVLSGYAGPVAVMSFNPHSVAEMKRLAPDVPRGLTTAAFDAENWPRLSPATRARLAAIEGLGEIGASFISHEARDLGAPRIAEIKASGLPVLCWTIRSPDSEREARKIADNVTFEAYLPA